MNRLVRPKDLTTGKPLPTLLLFSLPMFAGMFFQQAYNLADSWIAGNLIGSVALGAVGTCYPVTVFFIAIASGLGIGTSIYCSQQFGAGRYHKVRVAIASSLFCFVPFSVLLMTAGFLIRHSIPVWLSVPAEAAGPALRYLTVCIGGLPFLFLYNITTGILNGLGNSKAPLVFLILSSALNIILDLVLILAIPLGISGLALATLLSQAAAAFATLLTVKKIDLHLSALSDISDLSTAKQNAPRPSLPVLREILKLGIPSVVQHVFMSTGQLALQNIINGYGIITMTGYSIAFRVNGLFVNSLMALSNALSGFIAQNKGAGEDRRILEGYRICLATGGCFSLLVMFLLLSGGPHVLSFFVGSDPEKAAIVGAGMGFVRIVVPFYLLVCLKIITDGALRGIGWMTAFMMSSISDVLVRLVLGDLFSKQWGISGVWWIWPLAWAVGTGISCFAFKNANLTN